MERVASASERTKLASKPVPVCCGCVDNDTHSSRPRPSKNREREREKRDVEGDAEEVVRRGFGFIKNKRKVVQICQSYRKKKSEGHSGVLFVHRKPKQHPIVLKDPLYIRYSTIYRAILDFQLNANTVPTFGLSTSVGRSANHRRTPKNSMVPAILSENHGTGDKESAERETEQIERRVRGRGCALGDLHMRILYLIYCVDHPALYLIEYVCVCVWVCSRTWAGERESDRADEE